MAQPFDCLCGTPACRGRIAGARDMTPEQLGNAHLNVHIRQLLAEKYMAESAIATPFKNGAGDGTVQKNGYLSLNGENVPDDAASINQETLEQITRELLEATQRAEKAAAAACRVLKVLQRRSSSNSVSFGCLGVANGLAGALPEGSRRRGPTSRELSGEMGGDTSVC